MDVLGLITASIELYMSLAYEFSSGKAVGRATITVEVSVLCFSGSVRSAASGSSRVERRSDVRRADGPRSYRECGLALERVLRGVCLTGGHHGQADDCVDGLADGVRVEGAKTWLRLCVLVAPRLDPETSQNQIAPTFPDFVDWPKTVGGLTFTAEINGAPAIAATREATALDSALWAAISARAMFPWCPSPSRTWRSGASARSPYARSVRTSARSTATSARRRR